MELIAVIEAVLLAVWQLWAGPYSPGCYDSSGKVETRIEHCGELLETISQHAEVEDGKAAMAAIHVRRGYLYLDLRKFTEAIEDADSALGFAPEIEGALFLRAEARSDAGWFDAALADFDLLADRFPLNPLVYIERGIVHRRLGDLEKALSDYGRAIEINPEEASAYHVRAWAFYVKGRHQEALADSDKAVKLSSADPEARSTRAHILQALGRKQEALEEFTDLARNGPSHFVRRYQQILILRGYDHVKETGVSSDELVSGIEQCLQDGCKFVFDVELDQPKPAATPEPVQ